MTNRNAADGPHYIRADVDRNGDPATDFSFGPLDFSVTELRSSVVLRWEYRPGSTLFVVCLRIHRTRMTSS